MSQLQEPDDSDCCHSGCSPCIFDVYLELLEKAKRKQERPDIESNCIQPTSYAPFRLTSIQPDCEDTFVYHFECSLEKQVGSGVQLRPGQHLLLKAFPSDGNAFTRAYTPIPLSQENPAAFAVLIKLYKDGKMSRFIRHMPLEFVSSWRGPYGDFRVTYEFSHVLMIAQGTGIAPLYAVAKDMLANDDCESRLCLFLCCKSMAAIPLRAHLKDLSYSWNFKCETYLSCPESDFLDQKLYSETINPGKLTLEHIEEYFSGLNTDLSQVQVLICGSDQFNEYFKAAVSKHSTNIAVF